MTDSAFQVTLVGFYRMVPLFVLGLFTGLVADRFDRRRVLLFAQLWNATASAILGVLALTGRLALWHLAVLVTALGFSWALDLPSRRSYIYDMIGPRRVVNAMALDHVGMDGAKMLAIGFGPLGALQIGILASALGTPPAIALTAGTGLLLLALILRKAPTLWRLRTGP